MAKRKEETKKAAVKKTPAAKKTSAIKKRPTEKNPPETKAEPRSTMTTDEVSKYLGVTTARVSQLKRDGVIAPLPSGSRKEGDFYKPLETFIKVARHYRELTDSRSSRETEEMKNARERQLIAKAKREELEVSELEGELHRAEDIEQAIGAVLTRLRINLLSIPKGIAPQIQDEKDTNIIAEKIYERISRALQEAASLDLDKLLAGKE